LRSGRGAIKCAALLLHKHRTSATEKSKAENLVRLAAIDTRIAIIDKNLAVTFEAVYQRGHDNWQRNGLMAVVTRAITTASTSNNRERQES
jgi:hypothetical protein